jgi:hypothetical protein
MMEWENAWKISELHYTHHVEEYFYFYNRMHFKTIEPMTNIFNNYLITLQPNLPPRLWHDLIIYELHFNSKMDSGWMVL